MKLKRLKQIILFGLSVEFGKEVKKVISVWIDPPIFQLFQCRVGSDIPDLGQPPRFGPTTVAYVDMTVASFLQ